MINVTVKGKRHLVGHSKHNDQWYVLDLYTGKQELCYNYATAVILARDWNSKEEVQG